MIESAGVTREERRLSRVFVVLWAFAIVFDTAWTAHLAAFSARTPLVLVAIWAMFRPSSLARFLWLAALQTAVALAEQPSPGNHWFFLIIVHGTMFLALVGPERPRAVIEGLFGNVLPVLRAETVILYAFAGFSKLNSAFFDPERSCVGVFYPILAQNVPVLPVNPGTLQAAAIATAVVEFAIPALLTFRRTRGAGVLLAAAFHLALSAAAAPAFSTVAFALLMAFLPPHVARSFTDLIRDALSRVSPTLLRRGMPPAAVPLTMGVAMVPAAVVSLGWLTFEDASWWASRVIWASWLIGAVVLSAGLVLGFVLAERDGRPEQFARPVHAVLWIGPILAVLNGLSPYLGLKTENSYTMFSNLQTEGAYWNHWVLPRSLRVFGLQDDLVRVVSSSSPGLQAAADGGKLLVLPHFRQLAAEDPEASVVYEFGGRERTVERIADDPALLKPPPALVSWLLVFRAVDPAGRCLH